MEHPTALTTISPDQLADVTGGGFLSTIGSLLGPKAAKWTGIAEKLFGLFKGGSTSSTAPSGDTAPSGQ